MIAGAATHNSLTYAGWRNAAKSHRSHPVTTRRIRAVRCALIARNWVFDRY
jgi:hypothetical protein